MCARHVSFADDDDPSPLYYSGCLISTSKKHTESASELCLGFLCVSLCSYLRLLRANYCPPSGTEFHFIVYLWFQNTLPAYQNSPTQASCDEFLDGLCIRLRAGCVHLRTTLTLDHGADVVESKILALCFVSLYLVSRYFLGGRKHMANEIFWLSKIHWEGARWIDCGLWTIWQLLLLWPRFLPLLCN